MNEEINPGKAVRVAPAVREPAERQNDQDVVLARVEKRAAMMRRVVELSLNVTNPTDWTDQDGHPWLSASGAEKIARLFGVGQKSIAYVRHERQDALGSYYYYEYTGTFFLAGHEDEPVICLGTCSSRDPFWAKAGGKLRLAEEIDETNVQKSGYTNLVVNGVTRLLGLRALTWEQVKAGGINREAVAKVERQKGADWKEAPISENQARRLFAIASERKVPSANLAGYAKTVLSLNTDARSHEGKAVWPLQIKRKDYDTFVSWVEAGGTPETV